MTCDVFIDSCVTFSSLRCSQTQPGNVSLIFSSLRLFHCIIFPRLASKHERADRCVARSTDKVSWSHSVYSPPAPLFPTSVPLSTPRPCSTFLPSLPSRRSTANTACASPKSTTPRRWRGRGECGVPSVPVRGRAEGASRSPCASATGPCEQPFLL